MNDNPLITAALSMLWWLLPLALIFAVLKSRWFKGVLGEARVKVVTKLRLPGRRYQRLHHVTLPTFDGTTQIDHIFVSRFGVFVLETKNMKGLIVGAEHQAQWTQQFFKTAYQFQNPLRQNYKHTMALEAVLDIAPEVIHSVVAFVGKSTFKLPMPANVTQGMGYITYIKAFREPVLSAAEVQGIVAKIESSRLQPSRATNRRHVKGLKKRLQPSVQKKCPACGQAMVVRTAQRGASAGTQFFGCSTYPECKAVQPLH